ncbi:hypothetical protein C5167_029817 [Papaver somniferum]|nr:hypothetical protein C5167_029817 [Papaver somniferum]
MDITTLPRPPIPRHVFLCSSKKTKKRLHLHLLKNSATLYQKHLVLHLRHHHRFHHHHHQHHHQLSLKPFFNCSPPNPLISSINFTEKLCIEVTVAGKIAYISEELCIGCGICVKYSLNLCEEKEQIDGKVHAILYYFLTYIGTAISYRCSCWIW